MADDRTIRLRLPGLGKDLTELPLAAKALIATALLVLIGGIAAPSTVSVAAILSTLPYFAILAVASIGQHLVIQQRGLDLSTAGIMSFVAVVVTKLPDSSTDPGVVLFYIAAGLVVGAAIGAFTGLIVTLLQVPPLVTTIGVNAILFGLTYFVSTGASVQSPAMMVNFFVGQFLFVPTMVWVLLLVAAATVFVLTFTTVGRRFIAVSVNPPAAHAVGVPLKIYSVLTYAIAGLMYAIAAIMLSGISGLADCFMRAALFARHDRRGRRRRQSAGRPDQRQRRRHRDRRVLPDLPRPVGDGARLRRLGRRSGRRDHCAERRGAPRNHAAAAPCIASWTSSVAGHGACAGHDACRTCARASARCRRSKVSMS